MKKCLLIPGSFLPSNDTVTLLTYKRLKHLDMQFDVLALENTPDETILEELKQDPDFDKFKIEYLCHYDSLITVKKPYLLPLGIVNAYRYVKKALQMCKNNNYDCIYSSSIPGISHVVAYFVKKKYPTIFWYASFSDPIKQSPYKQDPYIKKQSIWKRILFQVGAFIFMHDIYEELAIHHADRLIYICQHQQDFTNSLYPNKEELDRKSIIQPLVYLEDWKMYQNLISYQKHTNKKLVISHLGRLYGLRRIDILIEALHRLKIKDPTLADKLVVKQYSEIQQEDVLKIKEYQLEDVFELHDKISYQESLQVMQTSDVLLLCDTLIEEGIQPYLPSKILEYLLLRKPILALAGKNSPSYCLLKQYQHPYVSDKVEKIEAYLNSLLTSLYTVDYDLEDLNSKRYSIMDSYENTCDNPSI